MLHQVCIYIRKKYNIVSSCQKLHTEAVNQVTASCQRGLTMGKAGIFRGKLPVEPSEEVIVEIIQNLIDFALEGNLTEELLRQDVGIVVGFVLGHPEVFKILAGGN
jgi:hypothetical protein